MPIPFPLEALPFESLLRRLLCLILVVTEGQKLSRNEITHVNFNHVNKIEARNKVLRLNGKLSVLLLFTLTCDLPYIASILFADVNFTHERT